MSDEKCAVIVTGLTVCSIVLFIASGISYVNYMDYEFSKKAIESGYVQGSLPGKSGVYWVKPDGSQCKCLEKSK